MFYTLQNDILQTVISVQYKLCKFKIKFTKSITSVNVKLLLLERLNCYFSSNIIVLRNFAIKLLQQEILFTTIRIDSINHHQL